MIPAAGVLLVQAGMHGGPAQYVQMYLCTYVPPASLIGPATIPRLLSFSGAGFKNRCRQGRVACQPSAGAQSRGPIPASDGEVADAQPPFPKAFQTGPPGCPIPWS